MKMMKLVVASAAMLGSSAAFAGATANVGVVSEYLFRGIEQSGGAAVQGGMDLKGASGLYGGIWGSTINFAGATGSAAEFDLYGGFSGTMGSLGFDVGGIYYWYSEEKEGGADPDPSNNTIEVYGKLIFGPATVGLYYSVDDYFALTDEAVMYPFIDLAFPMSKKVSLGVHVGQQMFDDDLIDDDILDYSVGVTATADSGISASFKFVGTDRDNFGTTSDDDDIKFVIGGGYSFEL